MLCQGLDFYLPAIASVTAFQAKDDADTLTVQSAIDTAAHGQQVCASDGFNL